MKVLVLCGGDSPEREVSLRSGKAVNEALLEAGVETVVYDPINGDKELLALAKQVDMVFPILHGMNGEDGVQQKKFELIGAPYLGSDSRVSALCSDKVETHKILERAGVRMPSFSKVTKADLDHTLFRKPFVLKPIDGGSTLDTLITRDVNEAMLDSAKELLDKYETMILEELIEGQEITVPVLGEQALPVTAIVPPVDGEFDYNNKYNGKSKEICPIPMQMVSEAIQAHAQELALRIHKLLGVRHLSRTDMFVKPDGSLVVLEINTIPGLTEQSLFPLSASAAGISMVQLVQKMVDLVVNEK